MHIVVPEPHVLSYPEVVPLCELPQHSPTRLHHVLTSASSTAATVIAATTTTIAGTIQSTHRNRPISAPISCFQPPSTAIFDVLWWCSIHVPDYNSGNPLIPYPHGYLKPYPIQVEAAHVKSIPSCALASVEYFSSTETRSPGNAASRRWTRRGVTQLYRA
jgi:hypothetical protein